MQTGEECRPRLVPEAYDIQGCVEDEWQGSEGGKEQSGDKGQTRGPNTRKPGEDNTCGELSHVHPDRCLRRIPRSVLQF